MLGAMKIMPTISTTSYTGYAELFMAGGAGGGGGGGGTRAGGGGAGGILKGYNTSTQVVLTPGTTYNIVVGTGGHGGTAGNTTTAGTIGANGTPSSALGFTANGGEGGTAYRWPYPIGSGGQTGQGGNAGGPSEISNGDGTYHYGAVVFGGEGGTSGFGGSPLNGSTSAGAPTYSGWGSYGRSGLHIDVRLGSGGSGGGDATHPGGAGGISANNYGGGSTTGSAGGDGTIHTGSGGGGGSGSGGRGGNGADGVVYITVPTSEYTGSVSGNVSVSQGTYFGPDDPLNPYETNFVYRNYTTMKFTGNGSYTS